MASLLIAFPKLSKTDETDVNCRPIRSRLDAGPASVPNSWPISYGLGLSTIEAPEGLRYSGVRVESCLTERNQPCRHRMLYSSQPGKLFQNLIKTRFCLSLSEARLKFRHQRYGHHRYGYTLASHVRCPRLWICTADLALIRAKLEPSASLWCGLIGIITPEQEDDRSNESGVIMNTLWESRFS
ncbi:hypothetical protein T265_07315 [Opisthorchis viverrini]|uniref:Uncharacterized protein n=1 Tax=Opisthorchis viverrini TaxID=6198 RepID=A0A074ZDG7_OPIVI|nr:hypothetical protein T265_07315 [Opisthorchis viverrini]KER25213.1 hypothetical protein T265_07315 [Opisthorchis viverrini]